MKLNKIIKITIAFLFFLCMSVPAFAQGEQAPDEEDAGNEALNPAPIGDYILPMLVLGVATAFVLLRKKNTAKV